MAEETNDRSRLLGANMAKEEKGRKTREIREIRERKKKKRR
jgi:hypothetical protein